MKVVLGLVAALALTTDPAPVAEAAGQAPAFRGKVARRRREPLFVS